MDIASYLLGKRAGGGGSSGALVPIVVQELPETGEAGKLYLVPKQTSETNNVFDEYIYINNAWEKIGTTGINVDFNEILMLRYNDKSNEAIAKVENAINKAIKEQRNGIYALITGEKYTNAGGDWGYLVAGGIYHLANPLPQGSPKTNIQLGFSGQYAVPYGTDGMRKIYNTVEIRGTWNSENSYYTVTGLTYSTLNITGQYLVTTNTSSYTPTGDYNPATKKYVDDNANPVVTTSSTPTYTIASLVGNQTYKLGEITSLTITASTTFDKESIIYFESGSTATSISIPDTLTNLGDFPTLTTASNVSTGTCDTNKNYIIAILNNIAVWKKY